MGSAHEVAAAAPLVGVQGFVVQGMHNRPGDVGVAGGLGSRCAVGDLAAIGGPALDGQEGLGDVRPAGVPLDAARLDDVLGLEHQGGFRLQAVMDRLGLREEVAHQVVHTDADTGGIDADVLDVVAFGDLLDLGGLVGERLPPPTVLFQDPEVAAGFCRWRDDHACRIVPGTARVVAQPDGGIAEGAGGVRVEVTPQGEVGVALL